MRLMLKTLNLCLILLIGVSICVAQGVEQSAVTGFTCPNREPNRERPETKLYLGDVTKKAKVLPQPEYWRWSRGSRVLGIAQVEVVIDLNSGRVVWARLLNGHSLLQGAIGNAVCRARFAPTDDVDVRASGIITYRARHRR